MATLNYVYAMAGARGHFGDVEVYDGNFYAAGNVGTSAVSAQTPVAAQRTIVRATAIGGAVYVKGGGAAVTIAIGGGAYLAAGATIDLALAQGQRLAVIDA